MMGVIDAIFIFSLGVLIGVIIGFYHGVYETHIQIRRERIDKVLKNLPESIIYEKEE